MRVLALRLPVAAILLLSLTLLPGDSRSADDSAAPAGAGLPYVPSIAEASDEAERAAARIRIPQGMKIDVFAAEPLLANPVSFCIDGRGRFYVVETFRLKAGVTDNRQHMYWLVDELACRTVADRLALYRKYLGSEFNSYGVEHERVRLIEDTTGDGRADRSTVFADGFNDAADGVAAGVLARGDNVWFACIPNLWKLRDENGDGRADNREILHTGYGVHVSFIGHDLHGLKFGPDGKLYFSIGDRGFHVEHEGKTLAFPDTGAVLRCNPDGSDLEVVHYGLRNPQELAFDEYGNLFTGDNNSDAGDKARWVYVVEGGDSGWRIGYQYLNAPRRRGPWNSEKLWYPAPEGDAAYIVPPLANLADGPSGLAYYPGTGLREEFKGCFFLCDFRGAAGFSGIRSFRLKPRGASFEIVDQQQPIWSVLATDVDFGPDGALYISDWVDGWEKTGKGRIYKVYDPAAVASDPVQEVKRLLAEPMTPRSTEELIALLHHADMRVRQEAQFDLAERGEAAVAPLQALAASDAGVLARIHAIWALGQIGRGGRDVTAGLIERTRDAQSEVRAQSAKVLGDLRAKGAVPALIELLRDPEPRVRFFSAIALGKLETMEAVTPLMDMLRENDDEDPYLRHAGVMGLVGCAGLQQLTAAVDDPSPAVRMAAVLTMRRHKLALAGYFLLDKDHAIVLEAARAVYDQPVSEVGIGALAELLDEAPNNDEKAKRPLAEYADEVLLRAVAANEYVGAASRLARVAADVALSEMVRTEALAALADWGTALSLDRFLGEYRPRPARDAAEATAAIEPRLEALLADPSQKIRQAACAACGRLEMKVAAPRLADIVNDGDASHETRVAALAALGAIGGPDLDRAVERAVQSDQLAVRREALQWLAKVSPDKALPVLVEVLQSGDMTERQGAFAALGSMSGEAVEPILIGWLDRLLEGQVEVALQLDLLEAARQHQGAEVQRRLAQFESARPTDDPLGPFRETLEGGDARRGREIFYEKTAVACLRCHKIGPRGGEVGPELTHVARDKSREYLLESLVAPNLKIAEGFETVVVATSDGRTLTGVFKGEDEQRLRLITADGLLIDIRKDEIEERARGVSAMPDQLPQQLTKSELRDLVEFLAGQK